ncbi:DUF3263 domain-containing protein [Pseudoclavibacter helvolus]|uniref:DUF3263 domain-containing protein n=1 Tax=Pseudoclavibacter helvolus TaxID=255205 RepID=UPI003C77B665
MLTDHERALLDFEDANPRQNTAKTHAIRERFGMTATAYYVAISGVMRTADAVMEMPQVVHRLERQAEQRGRQRRERREQRSSSA